MRADGAAGVDGAGLRNSGLCTVAAGAAAAGVATAGAGLAATGRGPGAADGLLVVDCTETCCSAAAGVAAGVAAVGTAVAGETREVAGAGRGETGFGDAGAVVAAGASVPDGAAAVVVDFAAPLDGAALGKASRNLRTTGASTVEEALLTNSPISLSLVRISLLLVPSSFASSCTRALPTTALLTVRQGGKMRRAPSCAGWFSSLVLHGMLTMGRTCFLLCQRHHGVWFRLRVLSAPPGGAAEPVRCRRVRRPDAGPGRKLVVSLRDQNSAGEDANAHLGREAVFADRASAPHP